MRHHCIEHIYAFGLALGGVGAALPSAERDDGGTRLLGMLERIERNHMPVGKRLLPVGLAQEHALWRHWMIRRRAERLALQRLRARIVMIGDLLEPLAARIFDQRVEADHGARQIIEQRYEALLEQRQPMLHTLMLASGRDRTRRAGRRRSRVRTGRRNAGGRRCAPRASTPPRSSAGAGPPRAAPWCVASRDRMP